MKKLSIVRRSVILFLLAGAVALASSATGEVPSIVSLKIEANSGTVKCVIERFGEVEIQDFQLQNPKRLVLDFIGARHRLDRNLYLGDGKLVERVRTAQFANSPEEVTRIVFDLKDQASYKVATTGSQVVVDFYNKDKGQGIARPTSAAVSEASVAPIGRPVGMAAPKTDQQAAQPKPTSNVTRPAVPATAPTLTEWSSSVPVPQQSQPAKPVTRPEASIASAWSRGNTTPLAMNSPAQGVGGYTPAGSSNLRPMSIDIQNADIRSVLRSISEYASVNIISSPEVEGQVTAHLKNVPWRQAMEIILKAHAFDYREENGIIRVSTMQGLMEEELTLQSADRKKEELLPLESAIVPLSFANANEMQDALQRIVSKRGNIEVEKGSNALVVTDIPKNLEEVKSLAQTLDKRINQVEIVAKMVDVDFEATRELGVRWDALNLSPASVSVLGDATVDATLANPVARFRVGTVRAWGEVQAIIEALERENKANIISNPRIVTADNREARILVGKKIPLIVSDEAGNPITEMTKVGIGLRVTPHVNSDNTITMDLYPEISELSAQATVQGGVIISISEADTRVVVADGETAVIGGLINEVESSIENGVPLLMDIPVLGNLFKFKNQTTKKRELVIFVTPKIIHPMVGMK